MPLFWLLALIVLPSVRATVECHTACGLCAVDVNNATAACKLCRECHKVHLRMMGPNKQTLSRPQNRQLEALEKREFKQVMKEYGWMPQDLVDSDNKLERLDDDEGVETDTDAEDDCVPLSSCINNDEEPEKRKLKRTTKTVCPTLPTPRNCPHIQPCKKTLVKKRKLDDDKRTRRATQSTMPEMILEHILTLNYKTDKERPTQPDYAEPDADYEFPPPTKLLKKTTTTHQTPTTKPTTSCVSCMPMCPLPCVLVTQSPPFLPLIPQEALEALITLKPTTTKLDYEVTSFAESEEENLEKMEIKKRKHEDTTKDYVYLYVGIPRDDKHARYE